MRPAAQPRIRSCHLRFAAAASACDCSTRLIAHALRGGFEILFPLVEVFLRGFGRGKNLQRRSGGFALSDGALDRLLDGFLHAERRRLLRRLLCSLLRRAADGFLHRLTHFGVELPRACFRRFSRFVDHRRGAVGCLLDDFPDRRLGDAVHRDLDGFLDCVVKLRVELLANDRHFIVDRGLRFRAQRFIEDFLRVRHHFRHVARESCLRSSAVTAGSGQRESCSDRVARADSCLRWEEQAQVVWRRWRRWFATGAGCCCGAAGMAGAAGVFAATGCCGVALGVAEDVAEDFAAGVSATVAGAITGSPE